MKMVEWKLIEQVRNGDKEAYRELVGLHKTRIHRFCYRLVQEPEDAQDLVQETFIQAYRKIHLYKPMGAFHSWLYSIAYRLFLNLAEKKKRHLEAMPLLEESLEFMAKINSEPLEKESGEPARVRIILSKMDAVYREPLMLRYHERLSPDDIATTLGVTPLAIKSRLYRGKQLLAKALIALREREKHHAM